ncbi:alpha/beta fold hydrolase [Streptomyces sp. CB02923]|uniref:alpha/beta fold hydrolase n=1 Tax=Streptomyces sp. CB02923 TaxID=1718985 RepID=UPI0009389209|nr:alpha/beta hydrolase [Streptomyces sp. CB02923]
MTAARPMPVVLLHALALDSSMWSAQAAALRRRGHHVLVPDQRGFGRSPLGGTGAPSHTHAHPAPSLDVVADDLARLLDEQGVDRFGLAGCSMGGYVAMAFLRRHPGRVRALALLSTKAGPDPDAARADREKFARLVTDPGTGPGLVEATTPLLVGATSRGRSGLVARLLSDARAAPPASLAWAQRAIAARPDSLPLLRSTDIPALVIAGAEDELVPLPEARSMARALPQGRLLTVPEAGHLPPLEAPEVISEALAALFAAPAPSPVVTPATPAGQVTEPTDPPEPTESTEPPEPATPGSHHAH